VIYIGKLNVQQSKQEKSVKIPWRQTPLKNLRQISTKEKNTKIVIWFILHLKKFKVVQ
jgi:hypothetical protein